MQFNRRKLRGLFWAACAAALLYLGQTAEARAADWPQWRGPSRDGSAPGLVLPASLPSPLPEVWKVEAGEGYSGPSVAGGAVLLFCRRGEKETVLCLEAKSGKERWRDAYDAPFKPESYSKAHGKGPFATPTVASGKVYVHGISGILSCYDLPSGKVVWRKDFAGKFKKPHAMWGVAASPLLEGGLCITGIGTEGDGAIAAFKADSGEPAWQLDGREPSYSSPVAANLAGRRQVIFLTRTHLLGLAPQKGEVLWEVPYKVKYEQNVVTPSVAGDMVFIAGWEEPTLGLKLTSSQDKLAATQVWSNADVTFFMNSPVFCGGHLYGLAQEGKGSLACIDAASGKIVWRSEGGMGEYASIVSAGDKLLVLADKGVLRVVAADPKGYKELQSLKASASPVWSHLAVTSDRLFIKSKTHLSCHALKAE